MPKLLMFPITLLEVMQMALAGFVHTPQSPADDTATCLYCNISLSGWEEDDEPLYVYLCNPLS
jgi:Inhibitor of Apoptosis domain